MEPFAFHPELFELRNEVLEALGSHGFAWLSEFASIDLLHDVYGLEVCGIRAEDDARSIEILRNCRRAMAKKGRVLIVERLIPEDGSDPVPTLLSDINMLVLSGGKERTNAEYGELLQTAGLKLKTVQAVAFPYGIIEAAVA